MEIQSPAQGADHPGFTPPPWRLHPMSYGYDLAIEGVSDPNRYGGWIVELHTGQRGDDSAEFKAEAEANCRLIAAAPELYVALKAVVAIADRATVEFDAARAALAKATGAA